MKATVIIKETFQYETKSRMCIFNKRRYEQCKCILSWGKSDFVLKLKNTKDKTNIDIESCGKLLPIIELKSFSGKVLMYHIS